MANTTIEHISLETVTEPSGFFGRKSQLQERVCFRTAGGHIYISESTLKNSGDSWRLFQARLQEGAKAHGIPFADNRE